MSIVITHRINVGLVPRKERTDWQIRLRITYCGNRMDLYTGLTIAREKWIDTAIVGGEKVAVQQVKKGCKSSQGYTASQINEALGIRMGGRSGDRVVEGVPGRAGMYLGNKCYLCGNTKPFE